VDCAAGAIQARPEIVVELARRIPEAQFRIIGSAAGEHPEVHEQLQRDALELANLNLLEPRPRAELAALYDRAVAVSNTSDFGGDVEHPARGVGARCSRTRVLPRSRWPRRRRGSYADGSFDRLAELAATAWAARNHQGAVGDRCRSYIAREHAASRMAKRWEHVLGIGERVP
jgi:alkylhydroperoxidase family enzyme